MSIATYGQGPGNAGNLDMLTPSGGGTFPSVATFPIPVVPDGFITRAAAPTPGVGQGSGWGEVLKSLALVGGSKLIDHYFGHDSRSAGVPAPSSEPNNRAIASDPSPVPGQTWGLDYLDKLFAGGSAPPGKTENQAGVPGGFPVAIVVVLAVVLIGAAVLKR